MSKKWKRDLRKVVDVNPHRTSMVLLMIVIIVLTGIYQDVRPVTEVVNVTTSPTNAAKILPLESLMPGRRMNLEMNGIYSPVDVFLYRYVGGSAFNDRWELLFSRKHVTGTFTASLSAKKRIGIGYLIINPKNESVIYEMQIQIHTEDSSFYILGTGFFMVWLGVVIGEESGWDWRKRRKRAIDIERKGLEKGSSLRAPLILSMTRELARYNYFLFGFIVLLSHLVFSYTEYLSLLPNADTSGELLREYFDRFILYDTKLTFVVFSVGTIGLMYSRIKEERANMDLHERQLFPSDFRVLLGRSMGLFMVYLMVWSLLTVFTLFFTIKDYEYDYNWRLYLLIVMVFVGGLFAMSLMYYTLDEWVPSRVKWVIPLLIYTSAFRIDFILLGPGWFFMPLRDVLVRKESVVVGLIEWSISYVYVFVGMLFVEVGVVLGMSWVLHQVRKNVDMLRLNSLLGEF